MPRAKKPLRNPAEASVAKAAEVFKKFHGAAPETITKVTVTSRTMPKTLIVLGVVHAIEYEVENTSSSKRKGTLYRHKMGDTGGRMLNTKVYLATDVRRHNFYLVNAKQNQKFPVFTERGIVG